MLEDFCKNGFIPSPLIVEGHDHEKQICQMIASCLISEDPSQQIKVQKRSHPDWIDLNGQQLKMDGLRKSLYELRHRPLQSSFRILSISEFQDCSSHIQNALLKTLEEPLSYWIILLGVQSVFGVLPTIRSRCLLYKLGPSQESILLSEEQMKLYNHILEQNELGLYVDLESILKNREKTKSNFTQLLWKASSENYPGHWAHLAPFMEEAISELDRNLNPKNVWEKTWLRSLEFSYEAH